MSEAQPAAMAPPPKQEQAPRQARSIKQRLEERQRSHKRLVVNVGTHSDPQDSVWVIRMLSEDDLDTVKMRATRKNKRNLMPDIDEGAMRRLMLQRGIVEGPPDWDGPNAPWKGSEEDFDALLADYALSGNLYEAVNDFTVLDEETRVGFR